MADHSNQRLSTEEWAAKKKSEKKELFDMAEAALSEIIQDGDKFEKFMEAQSRLNRYSFTNILLIYKQYPRAVQLKTFDDWAEKNVSIRKGEKSIAILEPSDYVKNDGTKATGYHVKKMFDAGQTRGAKPPIAAKLDVRTLTVFMLDTAPVKVEAVDELLYSKSRAYYDPKMNQLCIKRNTGDSLLLCQSVAYELAQAEFALADKENYNREEVQFSARCIGYLLCRKYGVDAKAFAVNQLPEDWHKKDPKEIKTLLNRIHDTAKAIEERVAKMIDDKNKERQKHSKEQER